MSNFQDSVIIKNSISFTLIWFEPQFSETPDYRKVEGQLRSIIHQLRIFQVHEECIHYIRNAENEHIIIFGNIECRNMLSQIHDFSQVSSIYVYGQATSTITDYCKVICVAETLQTAVIKLNSDQRMRKRATDAPMISTLERSSTQIAGGYLHMQVLVDAFIRMASTIEDKSELLDKCRREDESGGIECTHLDEFERTYSSETVLEWYTRESFVYKLLNTALRTNDIDMLVLFRFLIHDIYEELKTLQAEQSKTPYRVYRAQKLSIDEFAILMSLEGHVVSMNSFLSTTCDERYAIFLAGSAAMNTEGLLSVLFEFDLDPGLPNTKPFADISKKSHFPNEQEVLLMLGSLFRIVEVSPADVNGTCTLRMVLCSDDQNELQELLQFMRREVGDERTLFTLGALLARAGEWNAAERCYHRYLQALPEDSYDQISRCHHELALLANDRGDYNKSIYLLEKVLEIQEKLYSNNRVNIANTLNSISVALQNVDNLAKALSACQRALSMFKAVYGENHFQVVSSTINEGNIYYKMSEYVSALQCYEEALAIGSRILPENHIILASCHMNIGECYRSMGSYSIAFEYFHNSLEMKEKSLPLHHPDIADTYYNMGCAYLDLQQTTQSLELLKKSLMIYKKTMSDTHHVVVRVTKIIDKIEKSLHIN